MNVEQWLSDQLTSRGLFQSQADQVIQSIKASKDTSGIHWHDPVNSYPAQLYAALLLTAAGHALDWIDANLPKAWYRSVFEQIIGPSEQEDEP